MTGTGSAADWLEHAESDLAVARAAVGQRGVLPQQVAFHAQQAVEKSLKAVLIRHGVDFPKTHDLQELVELVASTGRPLPDDLLEALSLTPFAVQHRYPGAVLGGLLGARLRTRWAQALVFAAAGLSGLFWLAVPDGWWAVPPPPACCAGRTTCSFRNGLCLPCEGNADCVSGRCDAGACA